jgi:hypothetical protein
MEASDITLGDMDIEIPSQLPILPFSVKSKRIQNLKKLRDSELWHLLSE